MGNSGPAEEGSFNLGLNFGFYLFMIFYTVHGDSSVFCFNFEVLLSSFVSSVYSGVKYFINNF